MRNDYAYTSMQKFEKVVDSYLSANFLDKLNVGSIYIDDGNLLRNGADISCDNGLIIDSKIKNTTSLNEICQYPSVEITIKHNAYDGWFVNPNSITKAYLYISVFTTAKRYEDVTADNITKLNVMLFSKKELTEYITKYTTLDAIKDDALYLDEYNQRKNYYDDNGNKVFHLKYSPYKEGAVNLVFKREVYLSLPSTKELNISATKIERIK